MTTRNQDLAVGICSEQLIKSKHALTLPPEAIIIIIIFALTKVLRRAVIICCRSCCCYIVVDLPISRVLYSEVEEVEQEDIARIRTRRREGTKVTTSVTLYEQT